MSSRSWFWAPTLALAVTATSLAGQAAPADPPPSPLLLVQGIRDNGMPDLALEYLREIEGKLSPEDRVLVPLERARCLLDAAETEPDEGTRTSMTGEAKEAFNAFLIAHGKHPRASEASLALARLTSIEARAQLNRGRRMDVPKKDTPGYNEAVKEQRAEMEKARPMFLLASKQFAQAAGQLKALLKDPKLEPVAKQRLARETFDADLASAINKYHLAETFMVTGATDTLERDKYLEEAGKAFAALAGGPPTSRNVWVAKAWVAEVLAEQGKPNEADREFAAILSARQVEAEDGKRLVRFFQIQRKFMKDALAQEQIPVAKLQTSAQELRGWLARYGNARKPTREALAARYYLALALELQVEVSMGTPPKTGAPPALSENQRKLLKEAEHHYRALGQSDNDFTARAERARMSVVRKLMSEADRPPSAYPQFEEAHMAALIQMGKLQDAERARERALFERDPDAAFWLSAYQKAEVVRATREIDARRHKVVAFLEHAREVATDRDNPTDVTDNLLRLVYFYQETGRPYQAAILGEHIARTVKTTGGKAATAGLLALRGYSAGAPRQPNLSRYNDVATALRTVFELFPEIGQTLVAEQEQTIYEDARKTDTARAIAFARYLDEKFPNDAATDTARHQLAVLLLQEKNPDEAFDAVIKVRPGYGNIYSARQFEAFVARYLIASPESPASPERKLEVFRRTLTDLGKLVAPGNSAAAADARGYLGCRIQLAQMYLTQGRVDPDAEKNPETRGYKRALDIADEVLAAVAGFEHLAEKEKNSEGTEGLTLDGFELKILALDLRTRAIYLQARALVDEGKFDDAAKVIEPVANAVAKVGMVYNAQMRQWAGEGEPGGDEEQKKQRAEVARTAANIDKVRRDVVMVGFKLGAIQGKKDEAAKMFNLLKTAGGGVAANQGTLELMARELAAQIPALRKAGKLKEAAGLGEGLAILLKEFDNLKELSASTILFLGQTAYAVGQHEDALKHLAKIKAPVLPASLKLASGTPWWEANPLLVADGQERRKFQDEIREYRIAQLYTARALRGVGRLDDAEKLLVEAIGDAKKKGYAIGSLDFRKELAYAYEAKGAAAADPKAANTEWARALKEWNLLFQIAQQRVRDLKPTTELDPGTPEDEAKRIRNAFFDAFFEPQRVVVAANAQLIKDPAKLEASYARVAKSLTDLENVNKFNDPVEIDTPQGKKKTTVGAELVTPEVAERYWELVEKNPALKAAYTKAGGKFFLTKPQNGG